MHDAGILLLRLKGPMSGFGGVRVDGYGAASPIPLVSTVAGMIAAAVGIPRTDPDRLQAIQDGMDIAVAILDPGFPEMDYQTADLGKPHMSGPMWTPEGKPFHREGSAVTGTRITHRPYVGSSDMLVAVLFDGDVPIEKDELEKGLVEPVHPIVLGRTCCPPSMDLLHGWFPGGDLLEALANSEFAERIRETWIPIGRTTPRPGDALVNMATRKDWRLAKHMGNETYIRRIAA